MFTRTTEAQLSKSLKILNLRPYQAFSLLQPSKMTSLSNSRWQNRKERHPNQSTKHGDEAKRGVSERVIL